VGRVAVFDDYGTSKIYYVDRLSLNDDYPDDLLEVVFKDGELLRDENLSEIRARLKE
ncbi:hypothetical protein LCGC14_1513330, partial [marine sediment metagenome]